MYIVLLGYEVFVVIFSQMLLFFFVKNVRKVRILFIFFVAMRMISEFLRKYLHANSILLCSPWKAGRILFHANLTWLRMEVGGGVRVGGGEEGGGVRRGGGPGPTPALQENPIVNP